MQLQLHSGMVGCCPERAGCLQTLATRLYSKVSGILHILVDKYFSIVPAARQCTDGVVRTLLHMRRWLLAELRRLEFLLSCPNRAGGCSLLVDEALGIATRLCDAVFVLRYPSEHIEEVRFLEMVRSKGSAPVLGPLIPGKLVISICAWVSIYKDSAKSGAQL